MEPETQQLLQREILQREIRLRVATAKASGAAQLYATNPCGTTYHRALEFLLEAEAERMELAGLKSLLETEVIELTAIGAAVLTDAALSA